MWKVKDMYKYMFYKQNLEAAYNNNQLHSEHYLTENCNGIKAHNVSYKNNIRMMQIQYFWKLIQLSKSNNLHHIIHSNLQWRNWRQKYV